MNKFFRSLEHSLINVIAAIIPWLVPLVPAYLTGWHVTTQLGLPDWAGWVIGAIVEGLGLASMNKTIAFWENNRRYVKDVKKMPILIPLGTYLWYLVIVIVVNILLEWTSGQNWVRVVAVGLLSTLSVPTAALIAVTSIWTERLMEKEKEKLERKREHNRSSETASETEVEIPSTFRSSSGNTSRMGRPSIYQSSIYEYLDKRLSEENVIASFGDVVRDLGVSQSTASRVRNQWIQERGYRQ